MTTQRKTQHVTVRTETWRRLKRYLAMLTANGATAPTMSQYVSDAVEDKLDRARAPQVKA